MSDSDFTSIRVSTLRGDLKIPFDAYVRVAGKHILYLRKGDSFEGKRLNKLKEKKLRSMYIQLEHKKLYDNYLRENLDRAYNILPTRPIEARAEVIQGAQQAVAEDLMENPDAKEFYNVAKDGCQRYVDFILKERESVRAILQMDNLDGSISQHGVSVATIALAMAENLKITEVHPMNLLVMGCLIHDVEHYYSNIPISNPVSALTPEQLEVYLKHPQAGVDRLKQHGFYDELVLNIVLQHEEHIDGSGYPGKLTEKSLDPVGSLVSAANSFDRYMTFERNTVKDALKKILIEKVGIHALDHLKALQVMLKDRELL